MHTTDYPPKNDPTLEDDASDLLDDFSESLTEDTEADTEPKEYQPSEWLEGMMAYDQATHRLEEAKKVVKPSNITKENIHQVMDMITEQIRDEVSDTDRVEALRAQWNLLNDVSGRLENDEQAYDDVAINYFKLARGADQTGETATATEVDIAHQDFVTVIRQINNDTKVYMSLPGLLAKLK